MIRDATADDFPAILALNAASVHFLSPLDETRLVRLHAGAAFHRVIETPAGVQAFLLAFRETADYDSPNFTWFRERYPAFLYIDRVVVHAGQRGNGLGRLLYDAIIRFAGDSAAPLLTCEFDIDPPNPGSMRFHAAHGFREVGTQWLKGGSKKVSLQARAAAA